MITVRGVVASDEDWLLRQLRAFSAFYGTVHPFFPEDDDTARRVLAGLVRDHVFFVADMAGSGDHHGPDVPSPIGFIAGALTPHFYNPALTVFAELFWWVDPDYRGSSAGARLLSQFIAYGREHADMVVMSLLPGSPIEAQALTSRGFRLHERSFIMEAA